MALLRKNPQPVEAPKPAPTLDQLIAEERARKLETLIDDALKESKVVVPVLLNRELIKEGIDAVNEVDPQRLGYLINHGLPKCGRVAKELTATRSRGAWGYSRREDFIDCAKLFAAHGFPLDLPMNEASDETLLDRTFDHGWAPIGVAYMEAIEKQKPGKKFDADKYVTMTMSMVYFGRLSAEEVGDLLAFFAERKQLNYNVLNNAFKASIKVVSKYPEAAPLVAPVIKELVRYGLTFEGPKNRELAEELMRADPIPDRKPYVQSKLPSGPTTK